MGVYQFASNVTLTVTRDEGKFYVQVTGQPKIDIYAEGEKEFFLKAVDAQISFETDEQGRATTAALHRNGRDQKAKRIE